MTDTANDCAWLHSSLEPLPIITYPFSMESLPDNGIYFFYEKGECDGHSAGRPRIVRVGTHKNGNFKNRISEHFLPKGMKLDRNKPAPKDRSIFRKNLGRAMLNKTRPDYLPLWEIDFMNRDALNRCSNRRDMVLEQETEERITEILRKNFGFKYIVIEDQNERMGSSGLESRLIGTLSHCSMCNPSPSWLGNFSPKEAIKESGLWLIQHLTSSGITDHDKEIIFGLTGSKTTIIASDGNLEKGAQTMPKALVGQIIKFIDEHLERTGIDSLSPVEANALLEDAGILNDSASRPGLPLRKLLRAGLFPSAEQSTGGKGGRWFIRHT
jgi:hypothetical protein